MDQNALILNQNSLPCKTHRCGSLLSSLQRSLPFRHIEEQSIGFLAQAKAWIPDVILLRASVDPSIQEVIESCKEKWNRASIMVLFCPGWNQPSEDLPTLLNDVDDFLSCPFHEAELLLRIRRLLQLKGGTAVASAVGEVKQRFHLASLVGESPCFLRVTEKIPLLARCDTTVLILGETGSGKEVIARAIHYQGPRQGKPFIPVNCGALPDHLFENELFGHAKGAFTDAISAEKGLIGEAEGGTIFLDEVDALSPSAQVKLLRFLQDGEYRPVGSSRPVIADVRVVSATNGDLMQRVKSKLFREDLYYRLNSLLLFIPPLRERMEDVVHLTNYFLSRYAGEHSERAREISKAAMQKLLSYSWPGNVRELESVIGRALVLNTSETVQAADIDLPLSDAEELSQARSLREAKSNAIRVFERAYLANLLSAYRGNITRAANAAGKERRAFQRLLRKYNIERQAFQAR